MFWLSETRDKPGFGWDAVCNRNGVTVLQHGHLSDSFGLFYPSDHLPVLAEVKIN